MSWTGPAELRAQVQRLWDRGELLRALARRELGQGETSFPRRLTLKTPSATELSAQFAAARDWIAALRDQAHIRIEYRELNHRVLGPNRVPASAWLDGPEPALALLGRRREVAIWLDLLRLTRERRPQLLAWLQDRPLQALELAADWPRLLDVIDWFLAHPRPGIHLRQIDIPGVDSKFIEAHRGLLGQWLDRLLPDDAIDHAATGSRAFARRYGLRDKPQRLRLRLLDPVLAPHPALASADLTLDVESLNAWAPPARCVFITENETNFLAFPAQPGGLLLFGAGYGFEALAAIAWLREVEVHYWGDIDTHGFAILDQLRARLPQARSLLMDRATLLAAAAHWGEETSPTRAELPRLTAAEAALYDDLRADRIRPRLRLEQERIPYRRLEQALRALPAWGE